MRRRRSLISTILVILAMGLLWPIFHAPIWWVSLEAPNYPAEVFPDGVRIEFHFNGVFSGCHDSGRTDIEEDGALDCTHEMDTINHYVGMYPIASGGPVEVFFSLFLVAMVAVMLLAFLIRRPAWRLSVMGLGFALVAVWMGLAFYGTDGLRFQSAKYLEGRINGLGENLAEESPTGDLSPGEALIAQLKASLATEDPAAAEETLVIPGSGGKEQSLRYLKNAFQQNQRRQETPAQQWRGNGAQFIPWNYGQSLGRYFRDPELLQPMVKRISIEGYVFFWGTLLAMVVLLVVTRKPGGMAESLLTLAPAGLPLFFLIEYSAWLWWYGHNMNEMGAFTLKPFMPTVFGQGKVAQFTTNSYPEYGFGLMLIFAGLLLVATLLRRERAADDEAA